MKRFCALLLPFALAACGTLPQPFYGNPGGPEAEKLSEPPAPVLMVPPPAKAQLNANSAALFAHDLAAQMADHDVPTVAGPATKTAWQLGITASASGASIIPAYVVTGPDGKIYGKQNGAAVSASAWTSGDPATLAQAAQNDAPALTTLMTNINAQIQQANPQSLENRVPRVFIGAVTGAPGDGDTSLPLNLSRDLPGADIILVKSANQADFTVTGAIKTSPAAQGQILVELDWVVRDRNNRVVGQVSQLHDLNPSDIEPYWGDVAAAAASEAAGGITTVVKNEQLKKGAKPAQAAAKPN